MLDWLKQINPNVVIPVLVPVITWLWHHRKTLSLANARDAADAAITSAAHQLLDDPLAQKRAQVFFTDAAWKALAKVGVKGRPAWAQSIVDLAVEEGMAELAELLHKRELAQIAAGAGKVVEAFTPPEKPSVPKLDIVLSPDESVP